MRQGELFIHRLVLGETEISARFPLFIQWTEKMGSVEIYCGYIVSLIGRIGSVANHYWLRFLLAITFYGSPQP